MILDDPVTRWMAFACTWVSNVICVYLIVQHVRNYTQPGFQRYICRIIFIVPFYCTASWLALVEQEWSIFFETPRDCYEAWVIYNFMSLCMAYVGGPGAVVVKSEGKVIEPSWVLCTCCMKPIPVDGFFLRNCKQGTLQFVIAKPFLAFFTLLLFCFELYQVGNWSFSDAYVYVAIIYNFCYSLALFWMLLFYVGTEELLKPYKPLLKFFVFKTVIFLTFWQGLVVTFLATRLGWSPDESEAMQNWLICIEMFFAAIGMFFAFPHQEYQLGGAATPGWTWQAFKHAISISDVIEDIMFQFNPNYKAYVLHTDGGPSENVKRKKFRGKKKKRPAFTIIQQELGALGDKITKMSKLKPSDRRRLAGVSGDLDVEEGAEWHSAARKENILTNIQGLVGDKPQALVSWIPGITENERKQAELLDSDSDAGYDEENLEDNQLDDEVLTSSTDEEGNHVKHPRRGTGGGGGRRRGLSGGGGARGGRVAVAGSSSDEDAEDRTQGAHYQRPDLGHDDDDDDDDHESDWEGLRGGSKARQQRSKAAADQDDSWALFPGSEAALRAAAAEQQKAAMDDSWADFGNAPPAPASPPGPLATSAALAGTGSGDAAAAAPSAAPADASTPTAAHTAVAVGAAEGWSQDAGAAAPGASRGKAQRKRERKREAQQRAQQGGGEITAEEDAAQPPQQHEAGEARAANGHALLPPAQSGSQGQHAVPTPQQQEQQEAPRKEGAHQQQGEAQVARASGDGASAAMAEKSGRQSGEVGAGAAVPNGHAG